MGPEEKICPMCAETIKSAAKICPHCRSWQSKWSLKNPHVWGTIYLVVLIAAGCGLAVFLDGKLNSIEEFSNHRDAISVLAFQYSQRISGSNRLVTVVGTLTNHSSISWKEVSVEAQFQDKSGNLIDAIIAKADSYEGNVILPHDNAAFKIEGRAARPESDYTTCNVHVRWATDAHSVF